MTVFGPVESSRMILPNASASWSIGGFASKGEYSNLALLSLNSNDAEIVDIKKCFNDVTHIFSFGRDTGRSTTTVSFVYFIGRVCEGSSGSAITRNMSLNDIKKRYDENRVYKKHGSLQVTVDDFSFHGFLIHMSIGSMDPATKSCVVSLTFIPDQEA